MYIELQYIQPLVSLLAGILILAMPRLLSYVVAGYLILQGLLGLGFTFGGPERGPVERGGIERPYR